jgi:hypothetical protein
MFDSTIGAAKLSRVIVDSTTGAAKLSKVDSTTGAAKLSTFSYLILNIGITFV